MDEVNPIPRQRLHRATCVLAGIYNILWGLWSAADPQWLCRLTGLAPLNHPEFFAAMAMVVGLYGLVYWEIARRPERGWLLAAVGMTGKLLGPIGAVDLILRGQWPPSAFVLNVTNDLIWWVPFALYLRDAWPSYRRDWKQQSIST